MAGAAEKGGARECNKGEEESGAGQRKLAGQMRSLSRRLSHRLLWTAQFNESEEEQLYEQGPMTNSLASTCAGSMERTFVCGGDKCRLVTVKPTDSIASNLDNTAEDIALSRRHTSVSMTQKRQTKLRRQLRTIFRGSK